MCFFITILFMFLKTLQIFNNKNHDYSDIDFDEIFQTRKMTKNNQK